MRLGKNMADALRFAIKYPEWHTYANDRATKEAITRLENLGLVKTNKYRMFRVTAKGKAEGRE